MQKYNTLRSIVRGSCSLLLCSAVVGCGGSAGGSDAEENAALPNVELSDVTINEGDVGTTTISVPVTLSSFSTESVVLELGLQYGTAKSTDLTLNTNRLTIPAGATEAVIELTLTNDIIDEIDQEQATLVITGLSGATVVSVDAADAEIVIIDNETSPTIEFTKATQYGAESGQSVDIVLKASTPSEKTMEVFVETEGSAIIGSDLTTDLPSSIVFAPGETEKTFKATVIDDGLPEGGEIFGINLSAADNAVIGENGMHQLVILGDFAINDTGVTQYVVSGGSYGASPGADFPMQDAGEGFDAPVVDDDGNEIPPEEFDGRSGLSFTKIDAQGNALPTSSSAWSCVTDNRTGLTFEVKQPSRELSLRQVEASVLQPGFSSSASLINDKYLEEIIKRIDLEITDEDYLPEFVSYPFQHIQDHAAWQSANYMYYWFNEDSENNGGYLGAFGSEFFDQNYPISSLCAFPTSEMAGYLEEVTSCNTNFYSLAANRLSVCGFTDWRLPSINELRSIFNYDPSILALDSAYFPNDASGEYVSSTPAADNTGSTWCLDSSDGEVRLCNKNFPHFVRLVRGGSTNE